MDFRTHSKLKNFFGNHSTSKRIKSLVSFYDSCTDEERRAFHNDKPNFSSVYHVVLDSIQLSNLEHTRKPGYEASIESVLTVLPVLKTLLLDIPQIIKKRWQAKSITNLITQLLDYRNDSQVRLLGLEILLIFANILQDSVDDALVQVFSCSVNFVRFCDSNDLGIFFQRRAIYGKDSSDLFGPTMSEPTKSESIKLLNIIFTFTLSKRQGRPNFAFWFGVLKRSFLPLLYPSSFSSEVTGFRPRCPDELHHVVVEWLIECLRDETLREVVCDCTESMDVVLEILGQTFHMKSEQAYDSSRKVLAIYSGWVVGKRIPSLIESEYIAVLQKIIDHLVNTFTALQSGLPSSTLHDRAVESGKLAIHVFRLIGGSPFKPLNDRVWECLLVTLVNAANFVINTDDGRGDVDAQKHFAHALIEALFECYLCSGTQSPLLWGELQSKVASWVSWKPFVLQWKNSLVVLTEFLLRMMASLDKSDDDSPSSSSSGLGASRPRNGLTAKELALQMSHNDDSASAAHNSGSNTDDSHTSGYTSKSFLKIRLELKCENFNEAFLLFDRFLHLLGPLHEIESVETRTVALSGLIASLDIFLDAINTTSKSRNPAVPRRCFLPETNTLLRIYGSQLFSACAAQDGAFIAGQCMVLGTLSRLILTRSGEPVEEVYWASYYNVLHKIFSDPARHTSFRIHALLDSARLFALNPRGSSLLHRDLLAHCLSVLSDPYNDMFAFVSRGSLPACPPAPAHSNVTAEKTSSLKLAAKSSSQAAAAASGGTTQSSKAKAAKQVEFANSDSHGHMAATRNGAGGNGDRQATSSLSKAESMRELAAKQAAAHHSSQLPPPPPHAHSLHSSSSAGRGHPHAHHLRSPSSRMLLRVKGHIRNWSQGGDLNTDIKQKFHSSSNSYTDIDVTNGTFRSTRDHSRHGGTADSKRGGGTNAFSTRTGATSSGASLSSSPDDTRRKLREACLALVYALTCWRSEFVDRDLPCWPKANTTSITYNSRNVTTYRDVRVSLLDVFKSGIRADNSSHFLYLNGLYLMLLDNILVRSNVETVSDIVDFLLGILRDRRYQGISLKVVNAVNDLSAFVYDLHKVSAPTVRKVVDALIDCVTSRIAEVGDMESFIAERFEEHCKQISSMIHCLLNWVMALPESMTSDTELVRAVFDTMQRALAFAKRPMEVPFGDLGRNTNAERGRNFSYGGGSKSADSVSSASNSASNNLEMYKIPKKSTAGSGGLTGGASNNLEEAAVGSRGGGLGHSHGVDRDGVAASPASPRSHKTKKTSNVHVISKGSSLGSLPRDHGPSTTLEKQHGSLRSMPSTSSENVLYQAGELGLLGPGGANLHRTKDQRLSIMPTNTSQAAASSTDSSDGDGYPHERTRMRSITSATARGYARAQQEEDDAETRKRIVVQVKEAAEGCVAHLMNRLNNFPLVQGADRVDSVVEITEDEAAKATHLVYNKSVLISVSEFRKRRRPPVMLSDNGEFDDPLQDSLGGSRDFSARLTMRDMTGKYVWDFQPVTASDFLSDDELKVDPPPTFSPPIRPSSPTASSSPLSSPRDSLSPRNTAGSGSRSPRNTTGSGSLSPRNSKLTPALLARVNAIHEAEAHFPSPRGAQSAVALGRRVSLSGPSTPTSRRGAAGDFVSLSREDADSATAPGTPLLSRSMLFQHRRSQVSPAFAGEIFSRQNSIAGSPEFGDKLSASPDEKSIMTSAEMSVQSQVSLRTALKMAPPSDNMSSLLRMSLSNLPPKTSPHSTTPHRYSHAPPPSSSLSPRAARAARASPQFRARTDNADDPVAQALHYLKSTFDSDDLLQKDSNAKNERFSEDFDAVAHTTPFVLQKREETQLLSAQPKFSSPTNYGGQVDPMWSTLDSTDQPKLDHCRFILSHFNILNFPLVFKTVGRESAARVSADESGSSAGGAGLRYSSLIPPVFHEALRDTSSGDAGDARSLLFLDNNEKLRRSIKLLDQTPSRECHKIGLIYVARDQDDQNTILRNEGGSDAYERFVEKIGWKVDLLNHQGFLGGVHASLTRDNTATYFCTSTFEMIFHVVTQMRTKWGDPQQIRKKRQVGNDHVNIIWSDHTRDFVPTTISSSFNSAHIVIYPRDDGMYRIEIHSKAKVAPFGPLQDGMVISEPLLAPLVRQTALNASRVIRFSQQGYERPFPLRQKYINDIVSRYTSDDSRSTFLTKFFTSAPDPSSNKS